jgi:hypothetical protein
MLNVRRNNSFFTAIKQRMEKDIDEVGKIARQAKTKVDELEKDVCSCLTLIVISICPSNIYINQIGPCLLLKSYKCVITWPIILQIVILDEIESCITLLCYVSLF